MVKIKNWGVMNDSDGYRAPERTSYYLAGEVYGHPNFKDGSKVTTSRILASEGRVVTCRSRQYEIDGPWLLSMPSTSSRSVTR